MTIQDPRGKYSFENAAGAPTLPDVSQSGFVLGCAETGTAEQPRPVGNPRTMRSRFGESVMTRIVEGHFVDDDNKRPLLCARVATTTAGVLHLDTSGVQGSSEITADGTVKPQIEIGGPGTDNPIGILVLAGGTIGVDGIYLRLTIDGFQTYTDIALGVATSVTFPLGGIKVNFGAGDLETNDLVTGWSEAPRWAANDLLAAAIALNPTQFRVSLICIAEYVVPTDGSILSQILDELRDPGGNFPHLIATKRRRYHDTVVATILATFDESSRTLVRSGYTHGSETSDPGSFPVQLADGDTFIGDVDESGSPTTLTVDADPARYIFTGGSYAAGAMGDSVTFDVVVMGVHIETTLDLSSVGNTQADYHAALETVPGLFITDSVTDIVATTEQKGSEAAATILAVGGAAATKLGIGGSTPIYFTGAGGNVPNVDNVTAEDFVAFTVDEGGISGSTFTANDDDSVTWQTDQPGASPNGVQWTGGTGVSKITGWDTDEHNGTVDPGSGSFIDDGFKPGMAITTEGALESGNNDTFERIATVTADTITMTTGVSFTDEVATAGVTVFGSESEDLYAENSVTEWAQFEDERVSLTKYQMRAASPVDNAQLDEQLHGALFSRCVAEPIESEPGQRRRVGSVGGRVSPKRGGRIYQDSIRIHPDMRLDGAGVVAPSRDIAVESAPDKRSGCFFVQCRTQGGPTDQIETIVMGRLVGEWESIVLTLEVDETLSAFPSEPGNPNKLSELAAQRIENLALAALRARFKGKISNLDDIGDEQLFRVDRSSDLSSGGVSVTGFIRTLFYAREFTNTIKVRRPGQVS